MPPTQSQLRKATREREREGREGGREEGESYGDREGGRTGRKERGLEEDRDRAMRTCRQQQKRDRGQ